MKAWYERPVTSLSPRRTLSGHWTRKAGASGEKHRLARAFHPGEADDFSRADLEADVPDLQAQRFQGHAAQRQDRPARRNRRLSREGDVPRRTSCAPAISSRREDRRFPPAFPWRSTATREQSSSTSSSLWETKTIVIPCPAEPPQRGEKLLLLRLADAGGRLVEDQGPGAEPQEAQDLQLLPLAHGQRVHPGIRIEAEIELRRELTELARRLPAIRETVRRACRG